MRILWIPHASWQTPQRARVFCRALASRHEVHVTDWVADFRSPRDYVSRRYLRNFAYRRHDDAGITVHGIPRFSPALFSRALRRLNARLFSVYLRRIIRRASIDVVVGSFVVPPPDAPRLIFDVADDNPGYWRVYGRVPDYADEIAATEHAYLRKADAVVAVSTVLAERLRSDGYRGPLSLIPNGVDLSEYRPELGARTRQELGLSGPIVGLIGNHDKKTEMESVLAVADQLSGTTATLLVVGKGAALAWAQAAARSRNLLNIRFIGFVRPERVGAYFAAVDIGLCPYAKNPAADASSPMRLIAHSAAGSQVICTDLEEVRRMGFENVTIVDNTPTAIAAAVRNVLGCPRRVPSRIEDYDLSRLAAQYTSILTGEKPTARQAHRVEA